MKLVLTILTVAGGHFLSGHRARGYFFLVAIGALPILAWFMQAFWLFIAPSNLVTAPLVAASFYWIALAIRWLSSLRFFLNERTSDLSGISAAQGARMRVEATFVSIASLVLIVIGVFLVGIVPFLHLSDQQKVQSGAVEVPGQQMPLREGSVTIKGILYVKGVPAHGSKLVFMFANGFVSRPIPTDRQGRFEYTLPPGHWAMIGPHVIGLTGNIRYEIDPPIPDQQQMFVVSENADRQTYRMIVNSEQ